MHVINYHERSIADVVRMPVIYPALSRLDAGHLIIEIGPGRGDFLFHLAATHPDATVVGIEIKRKRVDKLIARTEQRGLRNICIVQDDARAAIPRMFADASVDEIHIQFPDPWPKRRHAKNRGISEALLRECWRVLKAGGMLAILTDSQPYAEAIATAAAGIDGLLPLSVAERDFEAVYPTLFAMKWKAEGRRCFVRAYRAKR